MAKKTTNKNPAGGTGFKPPTSAKLPPPPKPIKVAGGTPPVVTTTRKTTTSVTTKGANQASTQPPATSTPNQLTPKVPPVRRARKVTPTVVQPPTPVLPTTPPPQPAKAKGSKLRWTNNEIGLVTIALLAFFAFGCGCLYIISRYKVGYSPASVATVVPVTPTNTATLPDESTRNAIMAEVDRANQAVAEKGELQRQLSLARYAQERAVSSATSLAMAALTNATQRIVISGNVGNGNIITVGSTVTVHQVQPPVHRAPPKPVAYAPPQMSPQVQSAPAPVYYEVPPTTYYAQPPSQVVYGGYAPYGYYSRPGISFAIGIGVGRQWAGPIGNRYGYCSPGGGPYGYGRHR